MRSIVTVLLLALIAGCSSRKDAPVSYAATIQPILTQRCASCHNAERAEGTIVLTSYSDLMNSRIRISKKPIVMPGEFVKSWLYIVCSTNQPDYHMPKDTAAGCLLTKEEVALIGDWIAQGALDN